MARDRRYGGRIVAGVGFALFLSFGWVLSQQRDPAMSRTTLRGNIIERVYEHPRSCSGSLLERPFDGSILMMDINEDAFSVETDEQGNFATFGYPGLYSIRPVLDSSGPVDGFRTEPREATFGDGHTPSFVFLKPCRPMG